MIKKTIISLFLCLTLILTISACTNNSNEDDILDLTSFGDVMVYGIIVDMLTDPEDYVGRTVKVNGLYEPFFSEDTERYHHFVKIVGSATCCPQFLEFKWNEGNTPDDYPETGTEIEMVGIFGTYNEAMFIGLPYLAVDDILIVE